MPEEKRKKVRVGFPQSSRVLMNELFSRYPVNDRWVDDFPQLGYNEEEWDELVERGIYSPEGFLLEDKDKDKEDTIPDNDDEDGDYSGYEDDEEEYDEDEEEDEEENFF